MSRSDFRPSAARQQQEVIFNNLAAHSAKHCPECGAPTDSDILRTLLTRTNSRCVGQVCPTCKWEGTPVATIDSQGRMVRATAEGLPTDEVIGIIPARSFAPVCEAAACAQAEVVELAVRVVEQVMLGELSEAHQADRREEMTGDEAIARAA